MISQTAEYALRAVTWLAAHGATPRLTRDIAEGTQVPAGYLAKVLQTLVKAELVRSQRGLGGGFVLSRPPAQLTVLDVVQAVDPIQRIERCPLDQPVHCVELCPLHRRVDDAIALVEDAFAKTTIADLRGTFDDRTSRCAPRSSAAKKRPLGTQCKQ